MPSASDFKSYLAAEVLSEQRTISYRNVARALKVHVNAAKCMLYEFHEYENKKRSQSVHATYLLAGTKKRAHAGTATNGHIVSRPNDEDEPMPPSSPPPFTSSMLEPSEHGSQHGVEEEPDVPVTTITLVREEALEAIKQQYQNITSIHIYSLSPYRIQDLVTLTDISRGLYTDVFAKEDPLVHNKAYGVIQNPDVRRRKGNRPTIPEAPAPKFKAVNEDSKPISTTSKPTTQAVPKKEEQSRPGSSGSTTSAATTSSTKQPNLKRDASDFFKKSFGNLKPKPKLERQDTDVSVNTSVSGAEDSKPTETEANEEGESEDDAMFLDTGTTTAGTKKRASDVKRERDDKAAKLRKMMDSDDEDAAPTAEKASGIKVDPVASRPGGGGGEDGEDTDVAWSDSDAEKQRQAAPGNDSSNGRTTETGELASANANGEAKRRRGRRKVMKKKTMKDEDGYLVTREEAVWESFSEEEKELARSNMKASGSAKEWPSSQSQAAKGSAVGGKGGKGVAAKGGGNIMNFFGKK